MLPNARQRLAKGFYNRAVTTRRHAHLTVSPWARLAAFMAFLAVLSALWAPVSMLAQEVRTGQLGGLCSASASTVWHGDDASANPDSAPGHGASHCEMCGALGWALPPLVVSVLPSFAGQQVAAQDVPAALAAAVTGLPFSRGPPHPLN